MDLPESRDKIISDLYKRSDIDQLCERRGKNWADQLKSEAFLKLCELSPDDFNILVNEKRLNGWLVTTITNMSQPSSNFSKDIKGTPKGIAFDDIEEAGDIPANYNDDNDGKESDHELCEADLLKGITILDFFHRDIMQHFLENNNNISKTARAMGINREYVGKLVKESKIQIEAYLANKY